MSLSLLRFRLWQLADRLRRRPSRGAALRRTAAPRLRKAGLADLVEEEIVVDHARRVVVRGTTADGQRRYVKLDLVGMRLHREAAALRAAAAAGVPTPAIIASVPGDPAALVLGELAGHALRPGTSDAAWRAAGVVLRRLHSQPAPEAVAPRSAPGWRERCQIEADAAWEVIGEHGLLPAGTATRLADRLEERLNGLPSDAERFVHGDCQASHVVVEHDAVTGVIDWADATSGDPLWDLTVLTRYAPPRRAAVIEGYAPDPATRARMEDAFDTYGLLREAQAARWTFEHHQDPTFHLDALRRFAAGGQAR